MSEGPGTGPVHRRRQRVPHSPRRVAGQTSARSWPHGQAIATDFGWATGPIRSLRPARRPGGSGLAFLPAPGLMPRRPGAACFLQCGPDTPAVRECGPACARRALPPGLSPATSSPVDGNMESGSAANSPLRSCLVRMRPALRRRRRRQWLTVLDGSLMQRAGPGRARGCIGFRRPNARRAPRQGGPAQRRPRPRS